MYLILFYVASISDTKMRKKGIKSSFSLFIHKEYTFL